MSQIASKGCIRNRQFSATALAAALAGACLGYSAPALADIETISGEFAYLGDVFHNVAGGIKEGSALLQNIDLVFEFDVDALFGLENGVVSAFLQWNDDTTFSDRYSGDTQLVSNIEAPGAIRLYEFWYQHQFFSAANLRFGLYDLNSEFDALETAGLFLNGSQGMGVDYGQTGRNGPSVFPTTSLAARLHWNPGSQTVLRYALLDAVPGDPNDPSATRIDLGGDEGVLHALEFNYQITQGARFGIGGFLYSKQFDTILQTGAPGSLQRDDGNGGLYAFVDTPVYPDPQSDRAVSAFVRFGIANDSINPFKSYFGAGLAIAGMFKNRPTDLLGVAVASARTGSDFRSVSGADSNETTIELTYSMQINDWLRLQPDIQYVINPSADPALSNAFVVGVRLNVTRGFGF